MKAAGNALTKNSPIFDELRFFIKGMSAIRLAVVSFLISDLFGILLGHYPKRQRFFGMRACCYSSREVLT